MVVVKWTSAPAATLTRRRIGLLSADPSPTLPFMAEDADIIGKSIDEALSIDVVDCW
jgi:hypothetical protein